MPMIPIKNIVGTEGLDELETKLLECLIEGHKKFGWTLPIAIAAVNLIWEDGIDPGKLRWAYYLKEKQNDL